MDRERVADYLFRGGISAVDGWLSDGAASATLLLNEWQRRQGIAGNVAEIGIHHGRYFVLLANLRDQDEEAIAVDIFENQQLNVDQSGRGNYAVFTRHLARFTDNKRIRILKRDSKSLAPADISVSGGAGVRLFSVDGAHTAGHTLSDLSLAADCIADGGVVILDDFYNPDWPGVQEGFFDFVRRQSAGIVPFAYGNNKMFLCRPRWADALHAYIDKSLRPWLLTFKQTEIAGRKVFRLNFRAPAEIFDEDLSPAANLFFLKAGLQSPRCRLTAGWAAPQHNGVWTLGTEAALELDLTNLGGTRDARGVRLAISVLPLLHGARTKRGLRVLAGDSEIAEIAAEAPTMRSYEMELPRRLVANPLKLRFLIESPEAPAQVLGSDDNRPLGFFFSAVRVSAGSPGRHARTAG